MGASVCASAQPCVERNHRQLHRERDEKAQHDPHGRMRTERRAQQFRVLERIDARDVVMSKVKRQDRDQHQQAAELREEKELDAAYTRRSWPQMAIRKYIGTSISSQAK